MLKLYAQYWESVGAVYLIVQNKLKQKKNLFQINLILKWDN